MCPQSHCTLMYLLYLHTPTTRIHPLHPHTPTTPAYTYYTRIYLLHPHIPASPAYTHPGISSLPSFSFPPPPVPQEFHEFSCLRIL